MFKFNLLPHRAIARQQRARQFYLFGTTCSFIGLLIVWIGEVIISTKIVHQHELNQSIHAANQHLEKQLHHIATLQQYISTLKQRQHSINNLQKQQNYAPTLLASLAQQTPQGIYLRSLNQNAQHIKISGYAQSNDHVAQLLRHLNNVPLLEKPQLQEIRVANPNHQTPDHLYDFTITIDHQPQQEHITPQPLP